MEPDLHDLELRDVAAFLEAVPPFDALPPTERRRAVRALEITYVRQGQVILEIGRPNAHLGLIRTGAVELRDAEHTLIGRVGEGECFGYPSLLTGAPARHRVTAMEDTLLYLLPAASFHALRAASEDFDRFFSRAHAERIRAAVRDTPSPTALTRPVRTLVRREPIWVPPEATLHEAARRMTDERVSSLPVLDDGHLAGILTDRDLRARGLACRTPPDTPVRAVMTPNPVTIAAEAPAVEAVLLMSRHNIHHLPVLDHGRLLGMISSTDLLRLHTLSPIHLIGDVWKQRDLDRLAAVSRRRPELFLALMDAGLPAMDVARALTSVTDAITQRLLALVEAELGPPPVPYAWVAFGSQARQEQTLATDQDHGLVLGEGAEDHHSAYFAALAEQVTDGLAACGYPPCPGAVMARTPRWRQPLSRWQARFTAWIQEPDPQALMHATIFFDPRHVHGTPTLLPALQHAFLKQTATNGIFLAHMAAHAVTFEPPLGFFRRFVLERSGEHAHTFDIKHRGLVPIIDLARIHALGAGLPAVNTRDRLDALAAHGALAASDARDLQDALALLTAIRLQHHARRLRAGQPPDNHVAPESLSGLERRYLKDAFTLVRQLQSALQQRFQTRLIS
ncbi:hypothetical protein AWN76_001940 [Rhodothermaceae bacterium RA]|nr:hypothetical protein AWN76_001940 [Rhodothermaceae bacterium RA]